MNYFVGFSPQSQRQTLSIHVHVSRATRLQGQGGHLRSVGPGWLRARPPGQWGVEGAKHRAATKGESRSAAREPQVQANRQKPID